MRRTTVWLSIVVLALVTSASPAFAIKQSAKPPKPTVAKTQAPKSTVKGPKSTVQAPKAAKLSSPKPATASAPKSAKATTPKGSSKKDSTTTTSATTSGTGSTPTTSDTPMYTNDVALKVSTKPVQLAKLADALGVSVDTFTTNPDLLNGATSGIKNFGQLNAMVNTVLHNPTTVEFADLKLLMTGRDMSGKLVEGQTIYSLGQAKQRLGIADDGDAPTTTTSSTTTTGKSKKRTNSGGTQ